MIQPARAFHLTRRVKTEWICLFLTIAASAFGENQPKPPSKSEQKARAEFLSLPLSFEANRGQTNPSVKFLSRGDGYALFLTADSAVFTLRQARGSSRAVVRMKLAGANSRAEISGAQTLPGTVNYFRLCAGIRQPARKASFSERWGLASLRG